MERKLMENLTPSLWYRTWLDNATDRTPVVDVHKLADLLPHGSGIDSDWTIRVQRNGDVTVYGSYHAMNENGFYVGWRNFRFTVRKWRKADKTQALHGPSE